MRPVRQREAGLCMMPSHQTDRTDSVTGSAPGKSSSSLWKTFVSRKSILLARYFLRDGATPKINYEMGKSVTCPWMLSVLVH